jgi:hypothetical protein
MAQPPKSVDARQPCAKKEYASQENNERGRGFDVAAVTVEISATSNCFNCNRRTVGCGPAGVLPAAGVTDRAEQEKGACRGTRGESCDGDARATYFK